MTDTTNDVHGIAAAQLRSFVSRIENVEEEIRERNELKSDIYKEAKGQGLDAKIIKKVVAARRKDAAVRDEEDALFDLYWDAVHSGVDKCDQVRHARACTHETREAA